MSKIAIVGIGNPFRGDDAAGWKVIDALEGKLPSVVTVSKVRGDLAEILDLLATHSAVFFVDASSADASDAHWVRIDLNHESLLAENKLTSTHGFTLREAFALAATLGALPKALILYLIPGENFTVSEGVSISVEREIPHVVTALLNEEEIKACTKVV